MTTTKTIKVRAERISHPQEAEGVSPATAARAPKAVKRPGIMRRSTLLHAGELPYDDDALVPRSDVILASGLSRSTLDRMERAGSFPKGRLLTSRLRVWRAGDVRAWRSGIWTAPVIIAAPVTRSVSR